MADDLAVIVNQLALHDIHIEQSIDESDSKLEPPTKADGVTIKRIILEGGGVKGIAFVGGLRALSDRDLISNIKQIAGSSAGGIVAVLMAVGYSISDMEQIFKDINFNKLKDDSFGFFRDSARLLKHYGIYKGDYFKKLMGEFIRKKTGDDKFTFKQLFEKTGTELLLTGTNLSYRKTDYFHVKTTPDMAIVDAIRITMSIPFFFKSIEYNGCIYGDGGIACNFPFSSFWQIDGNEGELSQEYLNETIGMKVETAKEMLGYKGELVKYDINNLFEYGENLIETLRVIIERQNTKQDTLSRTVLIPACISSMKFDITTDEKKELYDIGFETTTKYINDNNI